MMNRYQLQTHFGRFVVFLAVLSCLMLASCTRMKLTLANDDERKDMIHDRVAKFHKALYWGNIEDSILFVRPERRRTFAAAIAQRRKNENLVDFEVSNIDFSRDALSAQVNVITRYFKNPTYTVLVREEEERWGYDSSAEGWLLEESRVVEQGKPHVSNSSGGRSTFSKPY